MMRGTVSGRGRAHNIRTARLVHVYNDFGHCMREPLQDGITAPVLHWIGILSIRIVHLVITSNTTRYRDVLSASAMLAASGRCGSSCCLRVSRSAASYTLCTIGPNACTGCVFPPRGGLCRLWPFVYVYLRTIAHPPACQSSPGGLGSSVADVDIPVPPRLRGAPRGCDCHQSVQGDARARVAAVGSVVERRRPQYGVLRVSHAM